jgi:hypothetical protein
MHVLKVLFVFFKIHDAHINKIHQHQIIRIKLKKNLNFGCTHSSLIEICVVIVVGPVAHSIIKYLLKFQILNLTNILKLFLFDVH